jgi:hypothetical protein
MNADNMYHPILEHLKKFSNDDTIAAEQDAPLNREK